MDIQKENNLIREAFNDEAHSRGFCLDQEWSDCENPYLDGDTNLAFDFFKSGWQAAIARMEVRINTLDEMLLNQGEALAQAKAKAIPEGFVLVPKEPTPKMIDATWNYDDEIQEMSHNTRNEFIYKAMIRVAVEEAVRGGNE